MKKTLLFLACALAALAAAAAPEPYANPALNPVKFKETPKHAGIPLIKDGKLNFVIVRDGKAEKDTPRHCRKSWMRVRKRRRKCRMSLPWEKVL